MSCEVCLKHWNSNRPADVSKTSVQIQEKVFVF